MERQSVRFLQGGDPTLHRLLHLVERAHLDLAHALARDAELGGEVFERDRLVGEAPKRARTMALYRRDTSPLKRMRAASVRCNG